MVRLYEIRAGADPHYVGCGAMSLHNSTPSLGVTVIVAQDDNTETWSWFTRAAFSGKHVVLQITDGGNTITGPFHVTLAAGVARLESAGTLTQGV